MPTRFFNPFNPGMPTVEGTRQRDKSRNKPEFNKKAKVRREKAKAAKGARKKNRKNR